MNNRVNILEGSVGRGLFQLFLPLLGTSFLSMAYVLVDTIWLGHLGVNTVAALGSISAIVWVLDGIAMIARTGGAVGLGLLLGRGKKEESGAYAYVAYLLTLVWSIICLVLLQFFTPQLLGLMGVKDLALQEIAKTYMTFYAMAVFFICLKSILMKYAVIKGNSRLPFVASTVGFVLNIVLDPILIFGCDMGVKGAGLATMISALVIFILLRSQSQLRVNIWGYILSSVQLMFKLGTSTAVRVLIQALLAIYMIRATAKYGVVALGVYSTFTLLAELAWGVGDSLESATSAFVSQNYGVKQYKRVEESITKSVVGLVLLLIIFAVIVGVFYKQIYLFIVPSGTLLFVFSCFMLNSVAQVGSTLSIVLTNVFVSLEHPNLPMIFTCICGVLQVILTEILSRVIGVEGVWLAVCITDNLVCLIMYLYLRYFIRHSLN